MRNSSFLGLLIKYVHDILYGVIFMKVSLKYNNTYKYYIHYTHTNEENEKHYR